MGDRTAGPSHDGPGSVVGSDGQAVLDEAAGPEAGSGSVDLLAAEQAAAHYWRQVAVQRRVDAARVQRRPIVRAAIALDRRTGPVQAHMASAVGRVASTGRRLSVVATGWRHRPGIGRRRQQLRDAVASVPEPTIAAADDRSVLVLHVGARPAVGAVPSTLEPIRPPSVDSSTGEDDGDGTPIADRDLLQQIDRAVQRSTAPLICLVGPGVRPVNADWLAHLVAAVDGGVVAAAPLVVREQGAWSSATPVDLLVGSAGLDIHVDPERGPIPVAHLVGEAPDPGAPAHDTVAVTAAALVVDRRAWSAAGGLSGEPVGGTGLDRPRATGSASGGEDRLGLDEAVVDLCARLGGAGGRIEVVPAAVVTEHRTIHQRRQLREPIDVGGGRWRRVVDARGPALVRLARRVQDQSDSSRPSVALSTATPSRKIARWSGDWHYAGDLAGALGRAGYDVRVQSAEEVDSLAGRSCDLHLVLRGLEAVRRTAGQRHVLWVISHPEAVTVAECDEADLVVVASARFADHLAARTSTPVEVLWQATEPRRFSPRAPSELHRHPITVVANARGVPRRSVTDALAAGLEPAIYGQGWGGQVDPRLVVADHVDPDELAVVYSSAGVVLNDHWETMARWGFVSNRIFDVLACATPVVSDHLAEVAELFGTLVPTWRTPTELRSIVEQLRADPPAAEAMADAGRDLVLEQHTFDHRVVELESLLQRHGLALSERTPTTEHP